MFLKEYIDQMSHYKEKTNKNIKEIENKINIINLEKMD